MEDFSRRGSISTLNLASRKAEEAALRRYQAVHWLDHLLGPLGISSKPSEKDFISCLRNGLILCKLMNIVQPGSVPKVVEKNTPSPSVLWEYQQLPAYQYFENVRNFLVAVREMKLPTFEASVFERDNLKEGSATKVVDCILAMKAYHEWKQMTGGNGVYKPPKSPLVAQSVSRIHAPIPHLVSRDCSRKLDMSGGGVRFVPLSPPESDIRKLEDKIVKALEQQLVDRKENMDNNLVSSYCNGSMDSGSTALRKILSSCLEEQLRRMFPGINSSILNHLRERSHSPVKSTVVPFSDLSNIKNRKCCRACLRKGSCNHWEVVDHQEKELTNIKVLLSSVRQEVELLQSQFHKDIKHLEDQVREMSPAALGYHNAVKENRNLYNMVQDLKGNIRVYCRIRPPCNLDAQDIINFNGEDVSLVVVDSKQQSGDKKHMFQFNRVFGSAATQDDVFRDIKPLVRSVMDGYNVCIFAYGQTGSGKTHTMFCPQGEPAKEMGISYLALNDLLKHSEQRKDVTKYEIQVQMVEIYDEQVRDLLADDSGMVRPQATFLPVKSLSDVMDVMKLGKHRCHSHCVLSVHVCGEDASGSILHSCLHLVDLAGSKLVETTVDKSFSCLVDVLTALAQKQSHIPYQNSKLTCLLQNSLGGNAKTLMLAHVKPECESFEETVSTLQFAQRVSSVELGASHANKGSLEVLELKAQFDSLKKALAERTPPKKTTKLMHERTPPQSRRLSIENGNSMHRERSLKTPPPPRSSRRLSIENGSATSTARTPPTRTYYRRSSLEGSTPGRIKVLDAVIPEARCSHNQIPLLSSSIQRAAVIIETAALKPLPPPSFQVPKTPEPNTRISNSRSSIILEVVKTPCATQVKDSQSRNSIRSIGKLIKGSSDKIKQKPVEVAATPKSISRPLRRQSLTGLPPAGLTSGCDNGKEDKRRNAKTPPPPQSRTEFIKRWI